VNILRTGSENVARVFASKVREGEKVDGVAHEFRDGVPVLEAALAWLVRECAR